MSRTVNVNFTNFLLITGGKRLSLKMMVGLVALLLLLLLAKWTLDSRQCRCESGSKLPSIVTAKRSTIKRRILIISEARSGSSFLGDLIQQTDLTYYSFEPLVAVEQSSTLYSKLLFRIFACQFDRLDKSYLKPVYWRIQYIRWNKMIQTDPGDTFQLFNQTLHRLLCSESNTILIKTIRFTLKDLYRTLSKEANRRLQIRVVFLVRDPRAVMNSRYKLAWCYQTENCTDPRILCQRMRENLEIFSKLDQTILLRHEDFLLNMTHSIGQLEKFLQLNFQSPSLINWIERHTTVDDKLKNPHSTYRDIGALAARWQVELPPEDIDEIEQHCWDVMQQLGYSKLEVATNQTQNLIQSDYPLRHYSQT